MRKSILSRSLRVAVVTAAAFLLLVGAGLVASRLRATAKADEVMQPMFQHGWSRSSTIPALWVDGRVQPCWVIQYDHSTTIVDFGPQFLVSWSGEIIMMSPADLEARISNHIGAVGQPATQPTSGGPPSH